MHYILVNATRLNGIENIRFKEVLKIFNNAGIDFDVIFTQKKDDAKLQAERITSEGKKHTIIAMGGDGTVHDIINGFKDFDNCCMGLIPFGTGNDFAASAGIPLNSKKAAEIIAYNPPRPIDFIELESGLRSINSVGMGIDVDVLKRTYALNSHGKGKYLRSLIASLVNYKSCNFTVKYDGKEEKHYGLIAALGNGRQFGGGIQMFPDAKIDDGYLDLAIVDYISRAKILGAFIKLLQGKINKIKNATFIKTKAAEFINENENYTIQAEGELYDDMPVKAHIVEGKLKFYLP